MIGLTDCVTKLICPNTTFEPMFSTTATPIATRKSSGAIHEVVVRMSRTMMSGTSTSAAPTTSLTASFCTLAVLAASPEIAPPSPMIS